MVEKVKEKLEIIEAKLKRLEQKVRDYEDCLFDLTEYFIKRTRNKKNKEILELIQIRPLKGMY